MPKRALITGITGQDGSYLAEHLLSLGYEVHGLVRRVALEQPEHRLSRLAAVRDRVQMHAANLDSYASIFHVFSKHAFDECYHLAAQSFVAESFADGFSTMATNINGTHYVLAALRELQPNCRFYFAGSSEMFGKVTETPQRETTSFHPRSPYGISKVGGFYLSMNYREAYGMFCCNGILFNHESPRRGFEFVTRKISDGVARIKRGLASELRLGNLDAKRDWGHAKDYVRAMHLMLQQPEPDDYIIATGETHSVREFCDLAFSEVGLDYREYVRQDENYYRPAEVDLLMGDASKARSVLKWEPTIGFGVLVQEMVRSDLEAEGLPSPAPVSIRSRRVKPNSALLRCDHWVRVPASEARIFRKAPVFGIAGLNSRRAANRDDGGRDPLTRRGHKCRRIQRDPYNESICMRVALYVIALSSLVASAGEYRQALPGYRYQFPRDHFDHPDFRTEWWYYTGNVRTQAGRRYGFELVFFRQGQHRGPSENPSTWRIDDLYLAHLGLTDIDGRHFYSAQRLNRAGPGIAGISFADGRIWNGNWESEWDKASGAQTLSAVARDVRFSLRLSPLTPPVIHGENGVSQKGEGAGKASYYVSFPRLGVDGTLNGQAVTGTAWMDHEWFTHQLEPNQVGWDWFSVQLENHTELMLFQIRRQDGAIDPYSAGTYIAPDGRATHLKRSDFQLEPLAFWTSPATGARYPIRWRITIPSLRITLDCDADLAAQELVSKEDGTPSYWEGAVTYSGSANGVGYLEMTGYAGRMRL